MLNPMSVMVLLDAEFRRLVLWVPVLLALGALAYFLWPYEPGLLGGVGVPAGAAGLCLGACFYWRQSLVARLGGGAGMALAVGFGAAWCAAHRQPP
ncbi:MAG: ComEC family competence protein, partial [Acetobacter sp.]|nr:ComEC family competence protein [Acetobacter sp.]